MSSRTKQPALPVDLDAWLRQMQTLEDLAAFVRAHAPGTSSPLPVLNWVIGSFQSVSAELSSYDPHALATLQAYARVFGVQVDGRIETDRTVYCVRGRLGRPEGSGPRIRVVIRATVWRDDDAAGGAA